MQVASSFSFTLSISVILLKLIISINNFRCLFANIYDAMKFE